MSTNREVMLVHKDAHTGEVGVTQTSRLYVDCIARDLENQGAQVVIWSLENWPLVRDVVMSGRYFEILKRISDRLEGEI